MVAASMWKVLLLVALIEGPGVAEACEFGERCTEQQPKCPYTEAHCNPEKKCVCDTGYGRGPFACHKKEQVYCHIINDPVAFTFGHEYFDLPLPCRYLATHVSAIMRYQSWTVMECHSKVHAFNIRSLGKFFVGGFDATVKYTESIHLRELHFKVVGMVSVDGEYSYELSMRHSTDENEDFSTSFDLEPLKAILGNVTFEVNDLMKRAILRIEHCALEVIYRPAHPKLGFKQEFMPGLSIAYDSTYDLSWLDTEKVVCLIPDLQRMTTGGVAADVNMSPSEVFLWRASHHAPRQVIEMAQDLPGYTQSCDAVSAILKDCTNRHMHKEAIEMCAPILSSPLFVHCYSDRYNELTTTAAAMSLYGTCMQSFCSKDSSMCNQVHILMQEAKCSHLAFDGLLEHRCEFV